MPLDKHLFIIKNEHPISEKMCRQYYQNIKDNSSSRSDFLDLSTLFANVEKCPFVTSHHYLPYDSRLVAEAIAKYIEMKKDIKP